MLPEMRPIGPDQLHDFQRALSTAFGNTWSEEGTERWRPAVDFARTLAVLDAGRIVATAAAFAVELTVPGGGTVPAAAVTEVGVLPTHRRRGLATAMMGRQLDDVAARGEPVALLLASEGLIYGRFGYGVGTWTATVGIDPRYGAFLPSAAAPGRVRLLDGEEAGKHLPEVHAQARRLQPGELSRSAAWWTALLADPESARGGASARFDVLYESPGGDAEGYASYRVRSDWQRGQPAKTAVVDELVAVTPAAHAGLWRYLLDMDLVTAVRAENRPLDDPVRFMLADPRRLDVQQVGDHLWCRVLDVPAALAARRYLAEGHLVLDVADEFRPASGGRFDLRGGPAGAWCTPTTAAPDLRIGIAELGACYLGGVRPSTLARAGRVAELTAGAVVLADSMFGAERAPWCSSSF